MQTYTIEAAKANLGALLQRVAHGEELLITEKERPIAKLSPPDTADSYRARIRALRGAARGIDTTVERS